MENFGLKLFEGASDALKTQALKTNSAHKAFLEKDSLYRETKELLEISKAQRESASLLLGREQRLYTEMLGKEVGSPPMTKSEE